jgi:hypothetical protein
MRTLYVIASGVWKGAKWVWTAIVVAILVNVASTLIPGGKDNFVHSIFNGIISWFTILGTIQLITIGVIVFLTLLALASGFITVIFKSYGPKNAPTEVQTVFEYIKKDMEAKTQKEELLQGRKREAFRQYLHTVEETNKYIRPRGFAQISQALVFADLPQDETFVDMKVVADEPVYDEPGEQKRQLEAMRQRTDLSNEEREVYLQRLRVIWRSQMKWDVDEEQVQQPLSLIEVLQRFTPTSPVAILLGVPGSGKTTFLRWLALQMARACLSWGKYSLPQGFGHPQVPILIQTNDYAQRLEKESITLKQFLIAQWNSIHPNTAMKLLEELAQGHCLVLFDGLDEGATAIVRKRVLDAINGFIIEYSSADPNIYNRFIITSRIADSEREAFSRYTHYTLLELDEQRIHQILTNLCLTLARYWAISVKGMQPLTEAEEAGARVAGTKQQVQLLHILTSNPNLMRLAINPMTLTMMVILQASGRNLPQQRMELYQMITRTLLDTWNRESGRKMFTDEELPLAEQLLTNLAFQLQVSGGMLTAYDVAMTTRQTHATFYHRQLNEIGESDITQFMETLRRSSGLVVEGGEDLFYFSNHLLQDYFVVLYLLRMPQEELNQLVVEHYHTAWWREPLLLMLSSKSRQMFLRRLTHQSDKPAPRSWSSTLPQLNPEQRASNLLALLREQHLAKQSVEELLTACADTRLLSVDKQQELGTDTVQRMAWKVLRQSFILDQEAMNIVLEALNTSEASICEGAAMMLQHSKSLPQDIQQRAVQKIQQILQDNTMYHQFSKMSYFEILRLYDTLYESLKVLVDRS